MACRYLDSCLFCKIIKGEIPCFKLMETDLSLTFLDIGPTAKGHALVIPKYHGVKLHDVPDEYLTDLIICAKKLAVALGLEDYNILQNNGKIAFQHVDHVHFHVIPKRTTEEGLCISLDNWPRIEATKEDLAQVQQEILGKLGA